MKKSLLAAAIAAITVTPVMAAEISVHADIGAYYVSTTDANGDDNGDLSGKGMNQIELKAKHKAANGMSVFGELEIDFDPVKNDGAVKTDDIKIGFKGDFGKFTVGQFDTKFEDKISEALQLKFGEYAELSEVKKDNDEQHFQFETKVSDNLKVTFDGTYVGKDSGFNGGETAGSDLGYSITTEMKAGSSKIYLGYTKMNEFEKDGDFQTNSYDNSMGVALKTKLSDQTTLRALYAVSEKDNGDEVDYKGLGLEHSMGDVDFAIAMQDKDGTTEWHTGAQYNFDKEFAIYAEMAKFGATNDEGDVFETGLKYQF